MELDERFKVLLSTSRFLTTLAGPSIVFHVLTGSHRFFKALREARRFFLQAESSRFFFRFFQALQGSSRHSQEFLLSSSGHSRDLSGSSGLLREPARFLSALLGSSAIGRWPYLPSAHHEVLEIVRRLPRLSLPATESSGSREIGSDA